MKRLQAMSEESFKRLGGRVYTCCDDLMRAYGESSSNPYGFGGALSLGWDWPTFSAIFPHKYKIWRKYVEEAKRRGVKGAILSRRKRKRRRFAGK